MLLVAQSMLADWTEGRGVARGANVLYGPRTALSCSSIEVVSSVSVGTSARQFHSICQLISTLAISIRSVHDGPVCNGMLHFISCLRIACFLICGQNQLANKFLLWFLFVGHLDWPEFSPSFYFLSVYNLRATAPTCSTPQRRVILLEMRSNDSFLKRE